MLSVEQAVATLLADAACRVGVEEVHLRDALGRALATELVAAIDVPPADNSSMDGYALRHADATDPMQGLPLSQRVAAGSVPAALAPGSAARIFTGAEVPAGADTVVMQEHCEPMADAVRVLRLPERGANIRRRGQDIARDQCVLGKGHRLRAQDLGLAASLGVSTIAVHKRLRVAILSTGDELVEPGMPSGPGRIYNSNRYILTGQLAAWGFEVVDLGVVRDEPGAVRAALLQAARGADVIITTGGVSVGEEDHVKAVVESLGRLDLWRIAVKPGKPFACGRVQDVPFLGLPGNPVSALITLLIVARPFLFACQGIAHTQVHPLASAAAFAKRGSGREEYLRVRNTAEGVELYPNQSSGALFSTAWGDGLVRQKIDQDIAAGERVDYLPWGLFN